MFAPYIIGIAIFTLGMIPTPTRINTMLLVAVPFCIIAVTITPIESAANGLTKINLIVSAALMA